MSNEKLANGFHDAAIAQTSKVDDRTARDLAMMECFFSGLPATELVKLSQELQMLVHGPVNRPTATFFAFLCFVLLSYPRSRLGQYLRNEAATFNDFYNLWRQKITETSRLRKELENAWRGL